VSQLIAASKKERATRTASWTDRLLRLAEERTDEMVRDPGTSLLLAEIVLYSREVSVKSFILYHQRPVDYGHHHIGKKRYPPLCLTLRQYLRTAS
jgi:hypothetical protein